jgi:hypothetical protein
MGGVGGYWNELRDHNSNGLRRGREGGVPNWGGHGVQGGVQGGYMGGVMGGLFSFERGGWE